MTTPVATSDGKPSNRRFPAFHEKIYFYDNSGEKFSRHNKTNIQTYHVPFSGVDITVRSGVDIKLPHLGRVTHICINKIPALVPTMAFCLNGTTPSSEPIQTFCLFGPRNNPSKTMEQQYNSVHTRTPKTPSASLQPFCTGLKALINAMALEIFKA